MNVDKAHPVNPVKRFFFNVLGVYTLAMIYIKFKIMRRKFRILWGEPNRLRRFVFF